MKEHWEKIQNELNGNAKLIAVSKTHSTLSILNVYGWGQRDFGENKVQELLEKQAALPKDIRWHLIGHLQTNKVKHIAPFVALIHSVDSLRLLKEINKQALKNNRIIPFLFQLHVAQEDTKYGLTFSALKELIEDPSFVELRNVKPLGIMGMATNTSDELQIRSEFQELKNCFEIVRSHYFKFNPDFKEISMGMSSDYPIALQEGSTMVRIGSALFGER